MNIKILFYFTSTLYLVTNDIIDQTYETRKNISRSLIMQWFGSYIVQKTWADTWLIHGLSHYIAGLFLKRHFGNNEYRYRLRKVCPIYNRFIIKIKNSNNQ